MRRANLRSLPNQQKGATLVVALLVLILIMMIGITAISTSNTQFKLAGNLQFEDGAMNNAETALSTAENWLSTNFNDAGFTTYSTANTPYLLPITQTVAPLTMTWSNANSMTVAGDSTQRYIIQQVSKNNSLLGSSQAVGGRSSTTCNTVNTYQLTGRGTNARGATKYVQSFYSVLNCP